MFSGSAFRRSMVHSIMKSADTREADVPVISVDGPSGTVGPTGSAPSREVLLAGNAFRILLCPRVPRFRPSSNRWALAHVWLHSQQAAMQASAWVRATTTIVLKLLELCQCFVDSKSLHCLPSPWGETVQLACLFRSLAV